MGMLEDKLEYLYLLEEKLKIISRKTIIDFTRYTKEDYVTTWFHEYYCKKIDDFIHGKIKNLMVFLPPQHGKSEISSRRVPAKLLGDNPNLKIGMVAYNHTISSKFNMDVQRIIESDEYKKLYPDTKISSKNAQKNRTWLKNKDEFEIINKKGSLVSVGVGGGLTSRKLDVAIMDDLYKDAKEAWSHTRRETVQDWYASVLRTRLHNKSQQLLVFTRWHEEDLAGYLLRTESESWEVVKFPAIKEDKYCDYDKREVGQALWPEQHSLETLLKIKENNIIVFDSLYQQNPTPKEGLVIASDEIKYFTMDMIKDTKADGIIAVGDIADEGNDYYSLPIGKIFGDDVYIIDVIYTQEPIEVTQPLTAAKLDEVRVDKACFESNNGGKGFAQKVRELKKGKTMVEWRRTSQNKHTKIIMKSGRIKSNYYFRSDGDSDYNKFLYDLTHYPKNGKAKTDDAIDSLAMMEDYITGNKWGW